MRSLSITKDHRQARLSNDALAFAGPWSGREGRAALRVARGFGQLAVVRSTVEILRVSSRLAPKTPNSKLKRPTTGLLRGV